MADGVEFRIEGLDAALRNMRELGPKLRRKGLRRAVSRGARIVRRAAVEGAKRVDDPKTPSKIWQNVGMQYSARDSKAEGGVVYRVGIRGGARATTEPGGRGGVTFHWRFLEFGTSKMAAKPFFRQALASNVERVTSEVVKALDKEMDKLAAESRSAGGTG